MSKDARRRVAEEAARLIVNGTESEYLGAKERAIMMLGLSSDSCRPTNKKIKECIAQLTKEELGEDEYKRRLKEMRNIACSVMEAIEENDPFLIGSTLSGQIRRTSDIDIHAYSDEIEVLLEALERWGFEEIELEAIENQKGSFNHLKWIEDNYPVEVTVYPWSDRDVVPMSSVTGKPMQRLELNKLRQKLRR